MEVLDLDVLLLRRRGRGRESEEDEISGGKRRSSTNIPELSLEDLIVEVGRLLVVLPVRPGKSVGTTEAELPVKATKKKKSRELLVDSREERSSKTRLTQLQQQRE